MWQKQREYQEVVHREMEVIRKVVTNVPMGPCQACIKIFVFNIKTISVLVITLYRKSYIVML